MDRIEQYDVVVGTPSVLSPAIEGVHEPPNDLFDLIIFDEAHHTPAASYEALLRAFPNALAVLLTATPFRRDRQGLPRLNVYTYGLGQALTDGVLAPVTFIPIDVAVGGADDARDVALAVAVRARMDRREHVRDRDIVIALPRQSFDDDSPPNASTSAALSLPRPPEV